MQQYPEMEFKNHKVSEAVCAFRFDNSLNNWNIGLFSQYYNAIKDDGFVEKQEQKPFEVSFEIRPNNIPAAQYREGEMRMVFLNPKTNYAIILAGNYISFHAVGHYPGWKVFMPELIKPFLEKYFMLGLGKGLETVQMLIPNLKDFGQGTEIAHFSQSNFTIEPNFQLFLKTTFNIEPQSSVKNVVLECSCYAYNQNNQYGWVALADGAHLKATEAFKQIIQTKLANLIK
jgi:hypothetical protein